MLILSCQGLNWAGNWLFLALHCLSASGQDHNYRYSPLLPQLA